MKRTVSVLLATSFLASASPLPDDPPPPPDDATAVEACLVIVIGGVVAWGLWKVCKNIPDPTDIPHPQAPPPTNPPPVINPTNAPPTNQPPKHWWNKLVSLNVSTNLPQHSIVGAGNDMAGRAYESSISYAIQSSTNLQEWQTEVTAVGWLSSGASYWAYYSNGVPLVTTYSDSYNQTNYVPWNLGTGDEPSKAFRLISVP